MSNKFFTVIIICLCYVSSVFAFEGVIEQQLYVQSTGQTSTVTWHFKGDKVKMEMKAASGEQLTLMVNSTTNSVILFNEAIEDEDGNKLYMEIGSKDIRSTIGAISTGKVANSTYNGKDSKTVEVMCDGVKYLVEYLPSINVDFADFAVYFKESMEVQALAVLGEVGFPVLTTQSDKEGNTKTVLKTTSMKAQVVAESEFQIPAGYKKFELPDQN